MSTQINLPAHQLTKVRCPKFVGYFSGWEPWVSVARLRWPTHATDLIDKRGWISRKITSKVLHWRNSRRVLWQPTRDLSRLHSCRLARRNGSWRGDSSAFIPDGAGALAAYGRFGGLPWMQGMFYGIGAAS